jgi:hypothetical protein
VSRLAVQQSASQSGRCPRAASRGAPAQPRAARRTTAAPLLGPRPAPARAPPRPAPPLPSPPSILWAFKLNPFEKLNLRFDATVEEIRKQYRKVSLLVHPDKCSHPQAAAAFDGGSSGV